MSSFIFILPLLILRGGQVIIFLALSVSVGVWLFVSGFGRRSDKGLFLCNGESAARNLFGEFFVKFVVKFLERSGIESVAEYRSPSDDVSASFKFLGVESEHFSFDFVSETFCFCLSIGNKFFPFVKAFDFGKKFVSGHFGLLWQVVRGFKLSRLS